MSHSISGVAGMLLPPMLPGIRSNSAPSKKSSKLFQTIESDEANSISQQQFRQAVSNLPTLDTNTIVEQIDPHGKGPLSIQDSSNGMAALKSSLNQTGSAIGAVDVPASKPINATLMSLEQLGSQTPTSGSPGSVVNVLI